MKLVYVLNSLGKGEATHFAHITNLLSELKKKNVDLVLIVEKLNLSEVTSFDFPVITTRLQIPVLRHIELFFLLLKLRFKGYKKIFIRITAFSAIISSLVARITFGETYLWQSGTSKAFNAEKKMSISTLIWILNSWLPNKIARFATNYFVTGPESMINYYADNEGIAKSKIKLLFNDIDTGFFTPLNQSHLNINKNKFLSSHQLDLDTKIILLVHKFSPIRKTNMYLKEIFKDFREVNSPKILFLLIGDGDDLGEAKELKIKFGLDKRVIFLGSKPNSEILKFYQISDIFINPSFTEGFPRVLIEAMACGLPIVATDAGGTLDILPEEQKKYVVPKDEPSDFSNSLKEIINTNYKDLGLKNSQHVMKYDSAVVANQYIKKIFNE